MVNAFRAGAIVAVLAGVVGWFMVLRRQSFAGHTLALVGFPGAAGAVLVGVSATYGLFVFAVVAALVIATGAHPGGPGRQRGVRGHRHGPGVRAGVPATSSSPCTAGSSAASRPCCSAPSSASRRPRSACCSIVAVAVLAILAVIGRPLLFASVDPDVAQARGVPVRLLSTGFLVLLALTAAEVSQITGTLLVFALLVAPRRRGPAAEQPSGGEPADVRRTRPADHLARALRRRTSPRRRSDSP